MTTTLRNSHQTKTKTTTIIRRFNLLGTSEILEAVMTIQMDLKILHIYPMKLTNGMSKRRDLMTKRSIEVVFFSLSSCKFVVISFALLSDFVLLFLSSIYVYICKSLRFSLLSPIILWCLISCDSLYLPVLISLVTGFFSFFSTKNPPLIFIQSSQKY